MSLAAEQYLALSALAYESMSQEMKEESIGKVKSKIQNGSKPELRALSSLSSWTLIAVQPNTPSGFAAAAFQNLETGEIVFIFRGTEPSEGGHVDLEVDRAIYMQRAYSGITSHLGDANSFVNSVLSNPQYNGASYSFTGHSLGGAVAQYMAYTKSGAYGYSRTVTFNAPGIGGVIEDMHGVYVNPRDYDSHVIDYANESDMIGNWRNDKQLGKTFHVRSKKNSYTSSSVGSVMKLAILDSPLAKLLNPLDKLIILRNGMKGMYSLLKNAMPFANHGMDDMVMVEGES